MHVKISTATVWEKKRYEADSVIDVPVDVYEKNSKWMKATDDDLTDPSDADGSGDSVKTAADDVLDAVTDTGKKKR